MPRVLRVFDKSFRSRVSKKKYPAGWTYYAYSAHIRGCTGVGSTPRQALADLADQRRWW